MNPPTRSDDAYLNLVIATLRHVSATEAAKVQGDEEQAPAHDAFTRLLHLLEGLGWKYVARLKSNRLFDGLAVRERWPHRFGRAVGRLR